MNGGMMDHLVDRIREQMEEENSDLPEKWVVFDFDGVCCQYDGWKGADVFGEPVAGVAEAVDKIRAAGYKVGLWTVRDVTDGLHEWLNENGFTFDSINSTAHNPDGGKMSNKPMAVLYVDDRGYRFTQDNPDGGINDIYKLLGVE